MSSNKKRKLEKFHTNDVTSKIQHDLSINQQLFNRLLRQNEKIWSANNPLLKNTVTELKKMLISIEEAEKTLDNITENRETQQLQIDLIKFKEQCTKKYQEYFKQPNEPILTRLQKQQAIAYFKKNPNTNKYDRKDSALPYSIIKDPSTNKTYALFKSKDTHFITGKNGILGKGSFGRVKLAQCLDDDTILAAKIQKLYPLDHPDRNEQKQEIQKEENLLKGLNQYIGSSERTTKSSNEKHYSFCEFMNGKSLHDHITDKGSLSLKDKLLIILEVLEKTKELHERYNLIHGDLSFNNILFDPNTHKATIIDFGFGNTINPKTNTIQLNFPIKFDRNGYHAPECAKGTAFPASDVYNLGKWIRWDLNSDNNNAMIKTLTDDMTKPQHTNRPTIDECIQRTKALLLKEQSSVSKKKKNGINLWGL